MNLTILKVGAVPQPLRDRFSPYPAMFRAMFETVGAGFAFTDIDVIGGEPLPAPDAPQAVLVTGSSYGVYDDAPWIAQLRGFIREAYAREVPMVGICYGHQAIADALGGEVRKSEKGWGLGRHTYTIAGRPELFETSGETLSVTCSHQDQVIVPPPGAEVILGSAFAPNAGLHYANGRTLSFQPHPEFEDDYGRALVDLRRGRAPDPVIAEAHASFDTPSDRLVLAKTIARFLARAMAGEETV